MHTRTTVAIGLGLAAGALALTGCSSGSAHSTPVHSATVRATPATVPAAAAAPKSKLSVDAKTAACWWAIRDQYAPGTAELTGAPTPPPQCAGLDADDLSDVVTDVIKHQSD
ncbi:MULTISPECIES: hypothetical protein [unclassified Streptomyces]|uniref:hypothetical protein n=1 Tax=unclassified Streptomyces TaxID=2593676 RepID=UPI002E2AA65F|nr:hypothetical protein [Streptomyces sp. NBC_00223]